jgi:ribosomal protein S18 acetylase RimI-like enzyme
VTLAEPDARPRLRPARSEDAPAMARIHREIPDAFLTTLGDGFLRLLYEALVTDPQAVAVVAENDTGVVGFATGVSSVRRFYRRFFRRHGIRAGIAAAPRLLRPTVLRRILETARYPRSVDSLPEAELLSIAVASEVRAQGIGRLLAEEIGRGLARRGVAQFKVVVDVPNEPSNRLFAGLGYERRAQIVVHNGISSNVWVRTSMPASAATEAHG